MKIAHALAQLFRFANGRMRPYTTAIVLAAGCGSRMQRAEGETKQLITLLDAPMIVHTLRAFDAAANVDDVILVARKEEQETMRSLVEAYGIAKVQKLVVGGDTRRQSAFRGVSALSKRIKYVAIHDGARPLITPHQIDAVISSAYAYQAATAGSYAKDSVKLITPDGFIRSTCPRKEVFLAATPQVFEASMYRAAALCPANRDAEITDDNMLIEGIGQRIKVVDTGDENLKITTPNDLRVAERILAERRDKIEQSKEEKKIKKKTKKARRA